MMGVPLAAPAQLNLFARGPDADQLYRDAITQVKLGHYDKALAPARKALELEPQNTDYMLLVGQVYLLKQDFQPAARYMQEVIQKDPRYKDPYLLMANIQIGLKQYDKAARFLDQGLHYLPGDRDLAVKKLGVLDIADRFYLGNKLADSLVRNLPHDSAVNKAFMGHYMTAGYFYAKSGRTDPALESFRRVLAVLPANAEARDAIRNLYMKSGNYHNALDEVNAQLMAEPDNYGLLMKKLGLLQQLHQYADALEVLHALSRKYPGDAKVKDLQVSLRMEAARYYSSQDPETLYKEVWDKDPGNRAALNKLIGMAMSRETWDNALNWIAAGLKKLPGDQKLLGLKMDILEKQGRYGAAASIAGVLYHAHPASPGIRERYVWLSEKSGQEYMAQEQYALAQQAFGRVLALVPSDSIGLWHMSMVLLLQKDSTGALNVLNKLVSFYPGDSRFIFHRAGLLAEMGRFEEALDIMGTLAAKHPDDKKYSAAVIYTGLRAGRSALRADELDDAAARFLGVLKTQPDNAEALNAMVNLYYRTERMDSALVYLDTALGYKPGDRGLLLK
jgi:tetratricopeptide (TPR) repeat protein